MNGFSRYLPSSLLLLLAGIASAEIETVTWLHTDHLGSPLMARDAQGNTLWQEDYSPWGERLAAPSANSADIGYTGHYEEADVGLTYAQARWYDPAVGRFLSADEVGFSSGGVKHFGRYDYADNNPAILIDVDGRDATLYVRSAGPGATNFGHVALRIHGDGYDKTYDFGRYRGGHGYLSSEGPGIMRVWSESGAFEASQVGKGDLKKVEASTSSEFDAAVMASFDGAINEGRQIGATRNRTDYQLKEDYHLLDNNCVTQALGGVLAGESKTCHSVSEFEKFSGDYDPREMYRKIVVD